MAYLTTEDNPSRHCRHGKHIYKNGIFLDFVNVVREVMPKRIQYSMQPMKIIIFNQLKRKLHIKQIL